MFKIEIDKESLLFHEEDPQKMFLKFMEKMAKSMKQFIQEKFMRSVELNAIVGMETDQEVIRAMIRSFEVIALPVWPPKIEAKFKDPAGHWYGNYDMPDEIIKKIEDLIVESIEEWLDRPEIIEEFSNMLLGQT